MAHSTKDRDVGQVPALQPGNKPGKKPGNEPGYVAIPISWLKALRSRGATLLPVLGVIASFYDPDTGECVVSINTIAKMTGLATPHICGYMNELENDLSLLEKLPSAPGKCNRYRIRRYEPATDFVATPAAADLGAPTDFVAGSARIPRQAATKSVESLQMRQDSKLLRNLYRVDTPATLDTTAVVSSLETTSTRNSLNVVSKANSPITLNVLPGENAAVQQELIESQAEPKRRTKREVPVEARQLVAAMLKSLRSRSDYDPRQGDPKWEHREIANACKLLATHGYEPTIAVIEYLTTEPYHNSNPGVFASLSYLRGPAWASTQIRMAGPRREIPLVTSIAGARDKKQQLSEAFTVTQPTNGLSMQDRIRAARLAESANV
jgi:hypothetical protein